MKYFWISLLAVMVSFSVQPVFADAISPPLLSYEVESGESFEFDLVFFSQSGGDYDVLIRTLSFTSEGAQKYEDTQDGVLTLEGDLLHFEPGEERYLPVKVQVPEGINDVDLQYVIGLRKRTQSFDSYELSSVVLLAVGEVTKPQGKILTSTLEFSETDADIFQAVDYRFENSTQRFITAYPRLRFLDDQGVLLHELRGPLRVFFPNFVDDASFLLKPSEEMVLTDQTSDVLFQIIADENVLDEAFLEVPSGKKILAATADDSPLSLSYRERRRFDFLYNPIFTRFAILIGLTLIGVSFLMKKQK